MKRIGEDFYTFEHVAMASPWSVMLPRGELSLSQGRNLARRLFEEVDQLENELSRFRPHADVARLSRLMAGESQRVSLAVFDCLAMAKAMCEATGGAFDVTVGPLMRAWRDGSGQARQPHPEELAEARRRVGSQFFSLDAERLEVTVGFDHMSFDLGAVGKGYGVDQLVLILEEEGIGCALLHAGFSTVYALGTPEGREAWPVSLENGSGVVFGLKNRALSGSGLAVRGNHIMDPRSGDPLPLRRRPYWAEASSAAISDAASTAFMVMDEEEILQFTLVYPDVRAVCR